MAILVINAGSVTIKYKLFDDDFSCLISGVLDNKKGRFVSELIKSNIKYEWEISKEQFDNAPELILNECKDYKINKIGFRIVHGGDKYTEDILLNDKIISDLEKISALAPLHNPPAIKIIKKFKSIIPDTPFYALFDTGFYSKMPEKAFMYALPYEYYQLYKVRRYGFHGISHNYLYNELKKIEPNAKKVISCHLGGGASISAINDGICIDTSIGFTPQEGLIMATRPGDVDDGAVQYLQSITKFNDEEFAKIQNEKSGLLGISGYTSDMRTLLEDSDKGNSRAKLAIDMYIYRIQKYISAYIGLLNGVDAIIISAGVGAGSDIIREKIFKDLSYFNLLIDKEINTGKINVSYNLKISSFASVPIWIIPTNEELHIAKEIKDK